MDEKLEFARRLREAMESAGMEPRPGVLLKAFNNHHPGPPVTFQAVSRWLRGEAQPHVDKLITLGKVLKIEPPLLLYGPTVRHEVSEYRRRWSEAADYAQRETFDAFLQLPPKQQQVVREVILTFAQVHGPHARERKRASGNKR